MNFTKGLFVAIEGASGVGKSSIIQNLKLRLNNKVIFTKEPTSDFELSNEDIIFGNNLFKLLLDDRKNHIERQIIPSIKEGNIIISDRYILSSLVFQRLDGLELEYIWSKNEHFLVPNITIIITVDDNIRNQRLESRLSLSRLKKSEIRVKEIQYTEEASEFLKSKGWNVVWIENTKQISQVTDDIYEIIMSLKS